MMTLVIARLTFAIRYGGSQRFAEPSGDKLSGIGTPFLDIAIHAGTAVGGDVYTVESHCPLWCFVAAVGRRESE